MHALLAAALLTFVPAQNDSFSPQVGVAVDPTLNVAPAFAVGRLCLPGSTCPAQTEGHSAVVVCMRAGLVPEKVIDLPFFNFPGGPIPAETQVIMFFGSDNARCPE